MIQTYILTRPDFKQNDIIAYMNTKPEYKIFIPTPKATDEHNITTSNTDKITLQQNVHSITNTHKQLNTPYTDEHTDNHTNKLSPAQSKLREAQFSYFKAQGQPSLDWLREAQL